MTRIKIDRSTLISVPGRGGVPRHTYTYTVDDGPLCQYGPGLTSLLGVLKRKHPGAEIIRTWQADAAAPAAAPDPATWPAPGDLVAVCSGHPMRATIGTVERLTPTLVVLAGGAGRYYRQRGSLRADAGGGYLRPLTDPEVAEALARAALERLTADADRIGRAAADTALGYGPDSAPGRRHRLPTAEATQLYRDAVMGILAAAQAAVYALDHPGDMLTAGGS